MYRSSKLYGLNKCSITISASHQSSSFLIQCKRSDDNEIIMISYSVCDFQQIARCISKTQCFWKIRWRITFVTVADLRVDASPKTMHHALKRFDTINPRIWQNSKVLYTHFPWTHSRPMHIPTNRLAPQNDTSIALTSSVTVENFSKRTGARPTKCGIALLYEIIKWSQEFWLKSASRVVIED